MFGAAINYLKSYIWNERNDDLSLDEAYAILLDKPPEETVELNTDTDHSKHTELENFTTYHKTGTITSITKDGLYEIDNAYRFENNSKDLNVGCAVNYSIFVCNDKVNVTNVTIVDHGWNANFDTKSTWCTRIIVSKVIKREGRILTVNQEDIELNLDKVDLEFLPIIGDWLELEVKSEIDENVSDLSGLILEINRISPVRLHVKCGKVTCWNSNAYTGTINQTIFFDVHSLCSGYIPARGDQIVAEIIESDQQQCSWRAIRVVPESMKRREAVVCENVQKLDFMTEHPSLKIGDVSLTFKKLNEVQSFLITIVNISNEELQFEGAEFMSSYTQCKLLDALTKTKIKVNASFEIKCCCTAKNVCHSKEFFLIDFRDFKVGKWISIDVRIETNLPPVNIPSANDVHTMRYTERKSKSAIRGQQFGDAARFIAVKLPVYPVSSRLFDMRIKYSSRQQANVIEELKVMKPCLFSNLTFQNYEDRFHTILFLDEIVTLISMQNYDKQEACFIKNGEFLLLEIENLCERRPSIIVGDRVIARDEHDADKLDHEGVVHQVGAKHLYLKFARIFHDTYNGEDYSISVIGNRSTYRRMHHAVHLAMRNLGKDILFPTRLSEKEPQIKLDKIETEPLNNSNERKKFSPRDAAKRIKDHNNYKKMLGQKGLQWHNEGLNFYQKEAVKNILLGVARPLPYIVFGPPGTGKTVTIIETVLQIIRNIPQSRLLICAPSNSAADLLAIRLIDSGVLKPGDLVRLVSLNYILSNMIIPKLVPYCSSGSHARVGTTKSTDATSNGISLGCNSQVLGRHRITVSTCSNAGNLYTMGFSKGHFSHIIIDEAGQASEPHVLIPLVFLDVTNGQAILVGDPLQLGPVTLCKIAADFGLQESFLERLINRFPYVRDVNGFGNTGGYDPRLITKLHYNYRSLESLLKLTSSLFYNDELIPTISNTNSAEAKLLASFREILPSTVSSKIPSIVFHGVLGDNYQTADSPSWFNPHEAAQVFYYINELYRLGAQATQIGIITPYVKQVKQIRQVLTEAEFDIPKIGTVEEFQGQEFDIILLSTVRSSVNFINQDVEQSIGFVSSPRRLNVAISRAKALLIIIGNTNLLVNDFYWRSVIQYCSEHGGLTGAALPD